MFESVTPGALPPELQWRYVSVSGGDTLRAYLVGPPVGVSSHWNDFTKPCRRIMSGGKLKCHWGPHCTPRFVCYLPLLAADKPERIVIITSKSLWSTVSAYSIGLGLEISRSKAKNNPPLKCKLSEDLWAKSKSAQNVARRKPEDIRPYLLHLWQDRELCEACGQEFFPSAKTQEAASKHPVTALTS